MIALSLALFLLASCTPAKKGDDTSAADTTDAVTGPDGFEDVTAPPEKDTDEEKDTTAADTTEKEAAVADPEAAVAAARAYLGESDPDTGYKYAYSYDGLQDDNGKKLHRVRVSWYIEEQERYSFCGYLLVNPDGTITKYSW